MGFGISETWIPIPALPLSAKVTLDMVLDLSEPQLPVAVLTNHLKFTAVNQQKFILSQP